jgi:WD40 repeat protein
MKKEEHMKPRALQARIFFAVSFLSILLLTQSCATPGNPDVAAKPLRGDQQGRLAGLYAAPTSEPTIKVQTGLSWRINGIAITPDGKRIVTGCQDQSVRVWDVTTGKELRFLEGHSGGVMDIGISSSGRLALSAGRDEVRFWDLERGTELRAMRVEGREIRAAAISPDGSIGVSGDGEGQIRLWDLRNSAHGDKILRMAGSPLCRLAFAPDGANVAAVSEDGVLRIFSVSTVSELRNIKAHKGKALCVAFSPDSSFVITAGEDERVVAWDVSTGQQRWADESAKTTARSVCVIVGSDSIACAQSNGAIRVLDAESGRQTDFFRDPSRPFEPWNAVSVSADGSTLAAGGEWGSLRAWDLASKRQIVAVNSPDHVASSEISADGQNLVCTVGKSALVWNIAEARIVDSFDSSTTRLQGSNGNWDLVNSRLTPEGRFLVLAGKYMSEIMELWDGKTARLLTRFEGFKGHLIDRCAISPDGRLVAAASFKGPIFVWDTGSSSPLFKVESTVRDRLCGPVFSPDSRLLASVDHESKVSVWDAHTGKALGTIAPDWVWTFSFSADSTRLLVGGAETATLYARFNGQLLKTLRGGHAQTWLTASLMNQDGTAAFSAGSDGTFRRWDLETGKVAASFTGHRGAIDRIALSKDETRVVSQAEDATIRVWNAKTGSLLYSAIIQPNREFLAWTPEGYYSGSERLARELVYVQTGDDVTSIDQYNELLYRPDLVATKAKDGELPDAARAATLPKILAKDGMPPIVEILEPASGDLTARDVTLKLRVKGRSGGIGKIVISLDGMPVVLSEAGRGLTVVQSSDTEQAGARLGEVMEAHISLRGGRNVVEASATNSAGSIESGKASRQYRVPQGLEGKPRLVLLLVAVTRYRDGALRLMYPVDDARAFKEVILKSASALYQDVSVIELFDNDVTRPGLDQAFDKAGGIAGSQDTFILYFAGHGIADDQDGEYYFLPVDFRYNDRSSILEQGISKKEILDNLLKVKAEKSILFFDTCNSGSVLSTPASRGLTEKTAVDRLKRAIGRAMIVASSDTQVALEGYKGHGVFTYALVDGISGKADGDRNGYVSVKELSAYVENAVPELTYATWGYEQVPQSLLPREDFPLAQDSSP